MSTYANLSGNSSITKYYYYPDTYKMSIYFRPTKYSAEINYKYSKDSAGYSTLQEMKRLAIAGQGLNSFIKKFGPNHYYKTAS